MRSSGKLLRGILVSTVALASMLGSRSASANWIMGAQQWAASQDVTYYSEIVSEFQVPAAPTVFENPISIWPGLEGNTDEVSYVLQPVLIYDTFAGGEGGPVQWWMQNETDCVGACGGIPQGDVAIGQTQVFPGDWIIAIVWIDDNNLGTGCNVFTGVNCNYNIGWVDLTHTNLSNTRYDVQVPASPNYALGLVFEASAGIGGLTPPFTNCSNFPAQTSTAAFVELMSFTWASGLYTPISPNYLYLGLPTLGSPFNSAFPFQPLTGPPAESNAVAYCGWELGVGNQSPAVAEVTMGW
jgi:hypothetical protein